jgi:hypothetical protein
MRESAQYESDAARSQSLGDVLEPLQHELIMAAIGMVSVRYETKEHDHRPFQQIGSPDRQVQGRIIHCSLRTLHPIDNALSLGIEDASFSQRHPGVITKRFNRIHN